MTADGRQLAAPHQIVNRRGRATKQINDFGRALPSSAGSSGLPAGPVRRRRLGCRARRGRQPAVRGRGRAGCPARPRRSRSGCAPWRIRSLPPRARGSSGRAGHGEHLPPGLLGDPGGDQAAGAQRRLHHHDAQRQAGDDPVAAGEVPRLRHGAERRLGHHGAASRRSGAAARRSPAGRAGRARRRPRRRCGRCAARRDARRRRCRAPGRRPRPGCAARSAARRLGDALAVGRGVAPADQRDRARRSSGRVAEHGEAGRRVVQQRQQRRVVRLAEEHHRPPSRRSAAISRSRVVVGGIAGGVARPPARASGAARPARRPAARYRSSRRR